MDDHLLNTYYKSYLSNKPPKYYTADTKTKYVRESDLRSIYYTKNNINLMKEFILPDPIINIDLHVVNKSNIDRYTVYNCVGVLVTNKLAYHRFTHTLIFQNEILVSETLILLDETVKFQRKHCVKFHNKTKLGRLEIIRRFNRYGKILGVDDVGGQNVRVWFESESATDLAIKSGECT